MCEKYAELALALKDVTEDLRLVKDENERLKEKLRHVGL